MLFLLYIICFQKLQTQPHPPHLSHVYMLSSRKVHRNPLIFSFHHPRNKSNNMCRIRCEHQQTVSRPPSPQTQKLHLRERVKRIRKTRETIRVMIELNPLAFVTAQPVCQSKWATRDKVNKYMNIL